MVDLISVTVPGTGLRPQGGCTSPIHAVRERTSTPQTPAVTTELNRQDLAHKRKKLHSLSCSHLQLQR